MSRGAQPWAGAAPAVCPTVGTCLLLPSSSLPFPRGSLKDLCPKNNFGETSPRGLCTISALGDGEEPSRLPLTSPSQVLVSLSSDSKVSNKSSFSLCHSITLLAPSKPRKVTQLPALKCPSLWGLWDSHISDNSSCHQGLFYKVFKPYNIPIQ